MSNYEATIVHLPDLIRGGRDPWRGTIAELIHYDGDCRDMTAMIDRAKAAGLYREDEDNLYEVLSELLSTNLDALREFADDPNAIYVAGPLFRLRWAVWDYFGRYNINPDDTNEPDDSFSEGATLFLERLDGNLWAYIDGDGFEFDEDHPADEAAPYEAVEQRMRAKHNLPDDIEIEMPW